MREEVIAVNEKELEKLIVKIRKEMEKAAAELNFEAAAELRDKMLEIKKLMKES